MVFWFKILDIKINWIGKMKQNISIKTYLQKFFKNLYLIFLYRPFIDKKSSARGVNICLQVSLWVFVIIYIGFSDNKMPKPLNELKTIYGIIGNRWYDTKSSVGTLEVILENNTIKHINISRDNKDTYDRLSSKKVKIFLAPGHILAYALAQLEDLDGNIYIKYDHNLRISKYNGLIKFNNFILFMIFFTIFLIFIVNRKDNKQSPPNP
ncbi:hypothetical protein [Campylobacter sp.]|uniref:hypothetical protein n=1 Tax=Campylobacter sp. TaxID=205 RepID=UPI002A887105|nr:hypothetical protein [Campylobacter sp.]MDY4120583.1 hypothetical protein [Campylobacter sp.]